MMILLFDMACFQYTLLQLDYPQQDLQLLITKDNLGYISKIET